MNNSENLDLNNVVNFLMEQTVRQIRNYGQRQLDLLQSGITVDQWVLLKIIEEHGQISQVDIAQVALKDTASITRILDLLQKKGLIQRNDDDFDRRKYLISLTPDGKGFFNRMLPQISQIRDQVVKGLSKEEIQALKSTLNKIRQNLS
jgi:MarR family transcriptional regulator, transcriptional regulator for hemolysin